jgi:hypothetical protein
MTMPRIGNLRAYLAGTGATGALVGGAVVVFLAATAFVAFNGFSLGGDDADGQVAIGTDTGAGAPEAAALALAAGPTAVAPTPAGGVVLAATGPGSGTGGGSGDGFGSDGPDGPGGPGGPGPGEPPPGGSDGGAVGGVVQDLDETTSGLGVNAPLSQVTGPLTQQVDKTVNDTLNNVGGVVGQPNLGGQVNDTVKNLSNGLLGNQGLLGGK